MLVRSGTLIESTSTPADREGCTVDGGMGGDLPPWDHGRLMAHRISAGSTKNVQRSLEKAYRDRRGILAFFLPGRRRLLDGLISGLVETLKQRGVSHNRKKRGRKPEDSEPEE